MASYSKKRALFQAIFCFLDESGFSERPTVRRTQGKKGITPIIRSSGSWSNISATGIVVTDSNLKKVRELCTFKRGSVRKEDTLKTLKHLARQIKEPIALLWDSLAQHKAKIVREYLHKHKNHFVIVERFAKLQTVPVSFLCSSKEGISKPDEETIPPLESLTATIVKPRSKSSWAMVAPALPNP